MTAVVSPGVPTAVLAEEAAIIDTEGCHHVNCMYYADLQDAARQRRWLAERRVRQRERFQRWAAKHPEELVA